tara:strand:+ start:132771 stop:134288 length:1518 start_codon:yes stop_codon:yes gene_type:complete
LPRSPYDNSADNSGLGEEAPLLARQRPGDNAEPLTVSEISNALKRTVEDRFGHVRLRGELSGVKRAASGHMYACLKDDNAVIDAVMWRGNAQRLSFRPEDGVEVVATGKITTYPGRSKYQIVVDSMEIAGEGALLALLEKLKARLDAEGLFAPERKRRLPFLPQVIGVVTSPTGSVIRDILHRLADRFPSRVLVWPVMVQGKGAAEQVAAAVRGFGAIPADGPVPRPDVLIVARGGGSIEDLWAFNEEVAVRAIADSPIPVISAVGHETDTTLADYAADLRAPTPTAAAELAVPVRAELLNMLMELGLRKRRGVQRPVLLARERLENWSQRLPDPRAIVAERGQRIDDLGERLRRGLATRAARAQGRLSEAGGFLRPAVLTRMVAQERRRLASAPDMGVLVSRIQTRRAEQLSATARLLSQLDPYAPLERGYAVVTGAQGETITSRAAASAQPALTLRFADGSIDTVPADGAGTPPVPRDPPRRKRQDEAKDGSGDAKPRQQSLF